MKTIKTLIIMLVLPFALANAQTPIIAYNNIDKITDGYMGVKNALTTGNGTITQGKAKVLLTELSEWPAKGMNSDQKKILNAYIEKLKFDTRHMSEVNDIAHQREHFESLSKNMYEFLKKVKMNTLAIYEEYCPMKKAYWLSENTAIKNPYYNGKEMATCGRVTATLAAVKK
jgi:hypothetical protein